MKTQEDEPGALPAPASGTAAASARTAPHVSDAPAAPPLSPASEDRADIADTVEFDIELEADATLGYASIQNAVPVVRSLRLTHRGIAPLVDVEARLACNPPFAEGIRLRFDRLAPGESRRIAPVDLRPDHAFLAQLPESETAAIEVVVRAEGREIARHAHPVEVLAYDQWAGTRALPELLAAFCMPNNPAVDLLVGKASRLLRESHAELSMSGYQSKSRDHVWKQVSALYGTIGAEGLQYAEPPASFGADGQKIRTPERILESRVATCLDLAMLFASAFEQAGLRPVVLVAEAHAWVGVWLHPTSFPDPLTDDVQAVRKRVDSGELLVFETTGVAHHHTLRPSLRIAMEQGLAHLRDDAAFRYAVDVHRARELQIRPLPSRASAPGAGTPGESDDTGEEPPAAIEPMPPLPALDADAATTLDPAGDDTPEGRLAKWKSRLLDLTLRNRLLNFKPTKATLRLVAPDLALLEDTLAEGRDFRIRALPALMEGLDPRVAQVHASRSGRAPIDDMALEALGNRELVARVPPDALDGHLLAIHAAARTGLEEGGANTLYLALGLLQWTEADDADAVHSAPILLIPVTLQRQSVRSGFRLARHDDEAIVNPTLLQLLKTSFELRVAGLETLPADERGVDVARVLQAFRLAVAEIPKWEVVEEANLGIFSFTKYLMWRDLQDRTEQLKTNRVVRHLIDHPGEAFALEAREEGEFDHLDETHRPQDILAPLLADSSQLKAICAIDAGRDLVLEGPPGTGKSQTITNLIAHSLGRGKTVLFVSEKLAALSVVHRRLNDIGLGPFCLELHSSKSKKTDVLQQLAGSLDLASQRTAEDWSREAERLAVLRQELNALVASLHREYPNGLTVYEAMGTCIAQPGERAAAMPWTDALTHDRAALEALRETARRIEALAGAIGGGLREHPLALIGQAEWSPGWGDELLAASHALDRAAATLRERTAALAAQAGIGEDGLSLRSQALLDALADVLLGAPGVPAGLARQAHDAPTRARIQALARHGAARRSAWERLGGGWSTQLAKLDAVALRGEWSLASSTWWPRSVLAKRAVTGRLAGFRTDGRRPTPDQVQALLDPLGELNDEDAFLRAAQPEAQALLEDAYAGIETDWTALAAHEAWATRFAEAVARFAAGDGRRAESIRLALQPLVGENRAALAPGGAAGRALLGYRDAWRDFGQALAAVEALAQPVAPIALDDDAPGALERIRGVLAAWQGARRLLQPWCLWRSARRAAVAQGLQGVVADLESGGIALGEVASYFESSYRAWWLKRAVDRDPVLRGFSSADHERKIREFRAADARFQKLTEHYIAATLAGRIPVATGAAVSADSELGRLRRERQKQRGHMPVRQLVQSLPTLLPRLKPCLLMSPLSVSQYLDAGYAQFDLVVFDEASQIPVWDAVGVIARGRQLAVVGDPKQLPPTSFFSKSADPEDGGAADEQVEDLESILDECLGAGMNRLSLQWHYRSRHESLITFSNTTYYDSRLVTFPSPVTDDQAVRFERVQGVYDRGGSRTNRAEAEAIVRAVEAHCLDAAKAGLSLGVVTFNQPQQALIETLLDARRRASPALDRAIAARASEKLFIKNLENVQGDERDVIFFSITYGADAAGKMTMNFGPLNGEGGHRRLNVAISRARESVVIFSTLMPEQIDLARVRAAGVRDLKHYLEFAIRGARALAQQSSPTGREPDSPFEVAVIAMLRSRGWVVHPQVGCSGYRIDLAVVDPRAPGRYLVGIECDGRAYHSGATARDRDRLRQHVLESLGWKIHRIWSTDWWLNAEGEIAKIDRLLATLLAEAEAVAETPPPSVEAPESPQETEAAPALESTTPGLPAYVPLPLAGGDPAAFHAPDADEALANQLRQVVEAEGPVPEGELFRRVARVWGLERTGARVVERLRALVPDALVRTGEPHETFYWPADADPANSPIARVFDGSEPSRRHVEEVCVEELANLALHVLGQSGAAPRQDVARSVCRLLGMARMTAEAERRVDAALDGLVASGRAGEAEGVLRPVPAV